MFGKRGPFREAERHILELMPLICILVAACAGRWEMLVFFAGSELFVQSRHEANPKNLHPRVYLDHWCIALLGALIAVWGVWLLRDWFAGYATVALFTIVVLGVRLYSKSHHRRRHDGDAAPFAHGGFRLGGFFIALFGALALRWA